MATKKAAATTSDTEVNSAVVPDAVASETSSKPASRAVVVKAPAPDIPDISDDLAKRASKEKAVPIEKKPVAKGKDGQVDEPGIPLESLGKGVSVADIDDKTNQIVIRRSGRVVERIADEQAAAAFADKKKLTDLDRETLVKLAEVRSADPEKRAEVKATLGPAARPTASLVNGIEAESERGRVRSEIERNDAEVYTWVEKQKRLREQQRTVPVETAAITAAARALEARGSESIEREAPFSAPRQPGPVVPTDVEAAYLRVGDKYYHPNNTKAVAFVDRGDKLETPSSAPKVAESLVKIAEARGWEEMRVKGTEGFRREVWMEASVRGIHVDGYKPSEQDKVELERRNTFLRDTNSVEVRSEAYQKLSPADGVRKDPTLAAAYGAEAAAKLFAEKLPAENRDAFVNSVKQTITHKLEAGEPVAGVKLKVPDGKLIEHGKAHYNFDDKEKPSYFVKVAEANGRERTYWGVGLEKAMNESGARAGDTVQLRVTESKGVVVEGNVRDGQGKVVGRQTVDSHRNEWEATVTAKAQNRDKDRQLAEDRQR